jgi:hypothetical protein
MDYMRELATKTLPWFSACEGGTAGAPRDAHDREIDIAKVAAFVDEIEERLKLDSSPAAWLRVLDDAGLGEESKRWWKLWTEGTEQARVELLADLYYIDVSAPMSRPTLPQRAADLLGSIPELIETLAKSKSVADSGSTVADAGSPEHTLLGDPSRVRAVLKQEWAACPFEIVLERELAYIERSRSRRMEDYPEAAIARARSELDALKLELMLVQNGGPTATPMNAPAPPVPPPQTPSTGAARANRLAEQIKQCEQRLEQELQRDAQRRATQQLGPRISGSGDGPSNSSGSAGGGGGGPASNPPNGFFRYSPRRAQALELFGLSFSGGGIRSATFNLGILQGLADFDLLRRIDYLSTVSGGGYIGGWLAGCTKHEADGIRDVQRWLSSTRSPDPEAPGRRPLRFLREYSNYLTPTTGFLSADTWTMVAIWFRNTLLNQLVLVLFLGALLLLPVVMGSIAFVVDRSWATRNVAIVIAAILMLGAAVYTGMNIRTFDETWLRKLKGASPKGPATSHMPWWTAQGPIQLGIAIPILLGSFLLLWPFVHAGNPRPDDSAHVLPGWIASRMPALIPYEGFIVMMVGLFACLTLVHLFGRFEQCFYPEQPSSKQKATKAALWIFVCSLLASAAGGTLLILAAKATKWLGWFDADNHAVTAAGMWKVLTFGPPVMVLVLTLMVTVHIGLLGVNFPDMRREWWSRLGAWMLIYSAAWLAICLLSLWSPLWVRSLTERVVAAGGATWILTTLAGVLTGRSAKTLPGTPITEKGGWRNAIAVVAPYAFAIGLLILVALGARALYDVLRDRLAGSPGNDLVYWQRLGVFGALWLPVTLCIVLAGLSFLLAWRIDVNEFSMHHFYRNRLVRCYLGATRKPRTRLPNRFTGFDPGDDPKLCDLKWGKERQDPFVGPYPIFNATLNIVRGSDLAAQERKGESFILSPLYCGYNFVVRERVSEKAEQGKLAVEAYRRTERSVYGDERGMSLGTAMAISGAAANPNMGYHSSPAAAFLMTVFNARLGWWVGNPRHEITWTRCAPRLGLLYHIAELTGNTSDRRSYVNLSDGGHFENLGLYELVRRRCRYIVACDAEEDAKYRFGGLGSVVRKCRADFGIDIDIRFDRLHPVVAANDSRSAVHCVVGTIQYPDGQCGTLLYVKSSLSGDEPADVLEYAGREKAFPHESTADQWFNESQFESYRALGRHVATLVFGRAMKGSTSPKTSEVFMRLHDLWYPPSAAIASHFVEHARTYDALLERVRTDKNLTAFDPVFFPALNGKGPPNPNFQRDQFYTYQAMIELMQSVYIDLELEENLHHPHNAGWMRIFQQWVEGPAFKDAWTASRETYSKRFRQFCSTELGLPD